MKRGLVVLLVFSVLICSSFVYAADAVSVNMEQGADKVITAPETPSYPGILCWRCEEGSVKTPIIDDYPPYFTEKRSDGKVYITGLKDPACPEGYNKFIFAEKLPSSLAFHSYDYISQVSCELETKTESEGRTFDELNDNRNGKLDHGDKFSGMVNGDLEMDIDGKSVKIFAGSKLEYQDNSLIVYPGINGGSDYFNYDDKKITARNNGDVFVIKDGEIGVNTDHFFSRLAYSWVNRYGRTEAIQTGRAAPVATDELTGKTTYCSRNPDVFICTVINSFR